MIIFRSRLFCETVAEGPGVDRLGLAFGIAAMFFAIASTIAAAEKTEQKATDTLNAAQPPLWSFAWVSDMHLDPSRLEFTAKTMRYISAELKPHFVLFTGDNNAQPAAPVDPAKPEPLGLRRQRFLKAFLQEHLKTPYVVIPGDDWPEDFDKVFGPKQYSFDCGGLHFLMLAPDRIHHGNNRYEGLSVFDKPTLEWIGRDLERSREQPTMVVIHEPIYPPTFLDAPVLCELMDRRPSVVAALQGHLHVDMEHHKKGKTYLVAPSLGKSSPQAMKLVNVYPTGLVVRTIVYEKANDRFKILDRLQKIEIAKPLRDKLAAPSGTGFVMAGYDAVPAHPLIDDPTLAVRAGELVKNAAYFLFLPK